MPEYFEITQQAFEGVITKPKLSAERLQKPPFRFIHDIVTNTMEATGFPNGLFEGNELNGKAIKAKEDKLAWINKLVDHLKAVSNEQINLNPKKLVAGLEPENTNAMLQLLANLAKNNQAGASILNQNDENETQPNDGSAEQEELQNAQSDDTVRKTYKEEQSSAVTVPEFDPSDFIGSTQRALGALIDRPRLSDKLLKRPPFRFLHDIVKSLAKTTGYPAQFLSEQDLSPQDMKDTQFKHDFLSKIVTIVECTLNENLSQVDPKNIMAGQQPEMTNLLLTKLAIASQKTIDVETIKQKIQTGMIQQHQPQTTENSKQEQKDNRQMQEADDSSIPKSKSKTKTKQKSDQIPAVSSQASDNGSTANGATGAGASSSQSEESQSRNSGVTKENVTTRKSKRSQKNQSNKQAIAAMPKLALQNIESTNIDSQNANENNITGDNDSQMDMKDANKNQETTGQPFAKYERPRTARRAPPKLKSNIISQRDNVLTNTNTNNNPFTNENDKNSNDNNNNNNNMNSDSHRSGIILENDDANSVNENELDEDEKDETIDASIGNAFYQSNTDMNNDVHMMSDEMREQLLADAATSNNGVIHGKLVRDILDAQQQSMQKDNTQGGLTLRKKLGNHTNGQSAEYKSGAMQIQDTRELIQKLCRISLPLGKCIDMVFADIDQMKNECQTWENRSQKYKAKLIEEQKQTQKLMMPLQQKLDQIQCQIDQKKNQILMKKVQLNLHQKTLQNTVKNRIMNIGT